MSAGKHTEGPWIAAAGISSIVGLPVVAASGQAIASIHVLPRKPDGVTDEVWEGYRARCLANARLIAVAPDHALACWAMCVGAGRWEPLGSGGGEFCIHGIRHVTTLDEFGCPVLTDLLRAEIIAAKEGRADA